MTTTLDQFVDALRLELKRHGVLLAWLDAQQAVPATHGPRAVCHSFFARRAPSADQASARARASRRPAVILVRSEEATFPQPIPSFSCEHASLITALPRENRVRRLRIRSRPGHGQALRQTSLTLMQRLRSTLSSGELSVAAGGTPNPTLAETTASSHFAAPVPTT